MLHISRQATGGFPEAIHERSDLGAARMRHQEPCNRQRGFLKILQLGPQHLAIFIQLLQRFVAVDQITVRSDPKLHVLVALEGKFFIVELEYLAGLLLPVEEVLHTCLGGLQLLHLGLKLCNTTRCSGLDYLSTSKQLPNKPSGIPLFLLRSILFLRTKSSLFACMSWTSLWYLEKAVSSLDCMAAACFRDFKS
jgi:hypothetical protein